MDLNQSLLIADDMQLVFLLSLTSLETEKKKTHRISDYSLSEWAVTKLIHSVVFPGVPTPGQGLSMAAGGLEKADTTVLGPGSPRNPGRILRLPPACSFFSSWAAACYTEGSL